MQIFFSEQMIRIGENLVRLLKERRFPLRAALWLYFCESEEWQLVLAVPKVRAEGKMKFYKQIQQAISKGSDCAPFSTVTVVDAKDPLAYSVGPAVKVGNIAKHSFSKGTINGRSFDGVYVYPVGT